MDGHSRPVARREPRAAAAMIWLALVGFAAGLALAAPPPLFRPGSTMADTDGNRIRAHQPHVYVENGTYYLIGSSHVGASDGSAGIVNLYTSEDLHAWTFQGGVYNHTADARPSLLGRNPRTRQYVLWAKGNSFQVATAPSLRGPYTTVGNFRPSESCTAGDSASFLDPVSNKAYMVYSQYTCGGENARAMMLLQLNDDWTAPAAGAAGKPVPTVAGHLEAPCPFFSELTKKHYIWTSQTSGWSPNPAHLLVSSNGMNGPWADLGNPSNNRTTFSTQGSHIMKLPMADATDPEGHTVERFLYVGDRYEPYINTIEGSRYIFLALEVHASGEVLLKPPVPWGLHDWPAGNGRLKADDTSASLTADQTAAAAADSSSQPPTTLRHRSDAVAENGVPCATCKGPIWSWAAFPAFFHGSDPNGTAGGGFTEAALDTISQFPIVTLEKWQGAFIEPYTWEEDAWVVAAKQIKARNPNITVIVWYDSVRIYQQNKTLNPGLLRGCTTGNFEPGVFLDSHPTPYLAMQADGVTPVSEMGWGCHIHNQANRQSQLYWQEMCLNMTRSGVVDGCGCDASWMDGTAEAAKWNMTQEQGTAWGKGHQNMLRELSWPLLGEGVTLGKDAIEIGDYVSGALTEECTPSNKTINNLLQVAARATQQGRRLIYECHFKPKDLENMAGSTVLDSISAFLIGVHEHQYFGLGAWVNRLAYTGNPKYGGRNFSDHWVDDVFGRQLGAPLDEARYESASKTWRRGFASGTTVEFKLVNGSYGLGKITWGGSVVALSTTADSSSAASAPPPPPCPGYGAAGELGRPCTPKWSPTYSMAKSTIVMPCNNSGFLDPSFAAKWGICDIDWSNLKSQWDKKNPMDCGELLLEQARRIKAVAHTTGPPATRVFVYRNLVKALPWYEQVADKLADESYSGFFLPFSGGIHGGPYSVPPCTHGLCSAHYHSQDQVGNTWNFANGSCGSGVP